MISRSDEELELFKKIDEQQKELRQQQWIERGYSGDAPILMQDDELPGWLKVELKHKDEEEEHIFYGRGMRDRGTVNYNDETLKIEVSQFIFYIYFFFLIFLKIG